MATIIGIMVLFFSGKSPEDVVREEGVLRLSFAVVSVELSVEVLREGWSAPPTKVTSTKDEEGECDTFPLGTRRGTDDGTFFPPTPIVAASVVAAAAVVDGNDDDDGDGGGGDVTIAGEDGREGIDNAFTPFTSCTAIEVVVASGVAEASIVVITIAPFGIFGTFGTFSFMVVGRDEHARREYSGFNKISRSR